MPDKYDKLRADSRVESAPYKQPAPHRRFWITDNAMVDDGHVAKMGASAWTVWTCLRRHADQSMRCYPSEARLAKETGITRRHVHTMIHRLIELGYLIQEVQGGRKNRGLNNQYRVVNPSLITDDCAITSQRDETSSQPSEITSQLGVVKSEVEGCEIRDIEVVKPVHTKYTHSNNTHKNTQTAATDGALPAVIDHFCKAWTSKYAAKYPFTRGKDAALLKSLFQHVGQDVTQSKRVIDQYLATDDPFIAAKNHPIGLMLSQLTTYIVPSKPGVTNGNCIAKPNHRANRGEFEEHLTLQ